MSAALNLVASRQPGAAPQALAVQRQQTLKPIKVKNDSFLEIKALGLNVSSFTTVHLVATERDNSELDNFAHGQRHLRVCKRIHLGEESPSIAEAAARELHIYKRLSAAPDASRRMIQLVDHERSENKLTLLMEYGGGGTLEGWRPEDAAELVSTCTAMLRCLDWLHKERVAHLDIKPANFVFASGRLKLIDFGVARMLDGTDSVLTLDAPFPGSVDYLAPEAICGKTNPFPPHDDASPMSDEAGPKIWYEVSTKTDMWAFGCVVCKLGTGNTPFPASEDRSPGPQRRVLAEAPMHLAAAFKSMAHLPVRGVGDVTQQLVSLCLKSSPSERPSAHELLSGPLFQPVAEIKPVVSRQVSLSSNQRVPPVRRQVTFTAPDKVDLLFHYFAFAQKPQHLFAARRVCKCAQPQLCPSANPESRVALSPQDVEAARRQH